MAQYNKVNYGEQSSQMPKANLAGDSRKLDLSFNGNLIYNMITLKLNVLVENGGVASRDKYEKIFNMYLKYSSSKPIKTAYEIDGHG